MICSEDPYYEEIGRKIKNVREVNHEYQSSLSRLLSCQVSAISDIELGKRKISIRELDLISRHYKCPISYFLPPIEDEMLTSEEETERRSNLS